MGIYYKWICESKKQCLDVPYHENDKHPKFNTESLIALGWLCSVGSWSFQNVCIINDFDDRFYDPEWENGPSDEKEAREFAKKQIKELIDRGHTAA